MSTSQKSKLQRSILKPQTSSKTPTVTQKSNDHVSGHDVSQTLAQPETASAEPLLHLQRAAGNRAVQRLLAKPVIQPKLTVGPAGDKYEQEADHVASQVMQGPVKPEEDAGNKNAQRQIDIQRVMNGAGFEAGSEVEAQIASDKGRGTSLPSDTRSFMEGRFGSSFENVNVHTDNSAVQLSRQMGAQAFTHGSDIYFDQGKYNPGSESGKQLLAHELTHVVQQGSAPQASPQSVQRQLNTISAGEVSDGQTLQLARGKAGRFFGSIGGWLLSLIPTLGLSALAPNIGDLSARMGFGFEGERTETDDPNTDFGVQSDKIEVRSGDIGTKGGKDNYVMRGYRYTPTNKKYLNGPGKGKAIVLLSGSGGSNEKQLAPVANFYCKQGSTVYAINYRGYGESRDVNKKGKESMPYLTEAGVYDDAYKIYHYVEAQGFSDSNIIVHGYSLGGGIASNLVKKLSKEGKKLGGLVLHSSIESSYQAARGGIPVPGYGKVAGAITKMSMGSFDTVGHLKELAKHDPSLPLHLMGGDSAMGDQLGLDKTGLTGKAKKKGMTDVTSHDSSGGHLDTNSHISDYQQQQMLKTLLGKRGGDDDSDVQWSQNPLYESK